MHVDTSCNREWGSEANEAGAERLSGTLPLGADLFYRIAAGAIALYLLTGMIRAAV